MQAHGPHLGQSTSAATNGDVNTNPRAIKGRGHRGGEYTKNIKAETPWRDPETKKRAKFRCKPCHRAFGSKIALTSHVRGSAEHKLPTPKCLFMSGGEEPTPLQDTVP